MYQNQVNNLYGPQGFQRTGKNKRPEKINPVQANNKYVEERLIKETETSDGRCDSGTRWVSKLRMCVDKNNIELLKKQSKGQRASISSQVPSNSRDVLREALRNYDSLRSQPNEKF